ncbi:MAG: conjugal transfer protein TraG N-terminal domain-containing protein [Methylomicrobium sp.]|nr:conjugal transfer protein TraG N-terminal domain-containing protein [Methylomicrobium sp.]
MSVSSYLEIYLSQFGWSLYGLFWDILVQTGLAYLPFIALLLRTIAEPIKSQEAKDASSTSLRRIEIELFAMFTVIVLAVQPTLTLQHTGLSYTKACASGQTVSGGNTGTTYDSTFSHAALGGVSAKIPLWWYGVLALSGGINAAAIVGIPCSADIRLTSFKISNARIQDPQLRQQARQFFNDCYAPAMAAFLDNPQPLPKNAAQEDLYWLGSTFLLNGSYQTLRAGTNIAGFSYDKNRDLEYNPVVYLPKDGKPTCAQWWTGQGHVHKIGLRKALIGQIETSHLTDFKTTVATLAGKPQQAVEEIALKTLIAREAGYFNGLRDLNSYNDPGLTTSAQSIAATFGGLLEALSFYPALYMIKAAAPIVQAVILMLIYLLMPFYLLFSAYDLSKVVFMSILVFSVKFWTVLWAVAHWLDTHLVNAIQPAWFQLQDAVSQNNLVVAMVVDFVIAGLFVILPLFWSGVLGWAGHRVGSEMLNSVNKIRDTSASAGIKGGAAAEKAGTKLIK